MPFKSIHAADLRGEKKNSRSLLPIMFLLVSVRVWMCCTCFFLSPVEDLPREHSSINATALALFPPSLSLSLLVRFPIAKSTLFLFWVQVVLMVAALLRTALLGGVINHTRQATLGGLRVVSKGDGSCHSAGLLRMPRAVVTRSERLGNSSQKSVRFFASNSGRS